MTTSETKICQNCKASFVIDAQDFDFYKKIDVPPPTFCPDCRMTRRMTWRNERTLWRRVCGLCQKNIITAFAPTEEATVYCRPCWYSDGWDPLDYGMDVDFSRPFFEQWSELYSRVPRFSMWHNRETTDCEYSNFIGSGKRNYLSYSMVDCENVAYCYGTDRSTESYDCTFLTDGSLCYENIEGDNNYKCSYLIRSRDCVDSMFLFDCVNCQNCILSWNLRNKQYVIENKQYTKEDYKKKVEELNLGSFKELGFLKKKFSEVRRKKALHKYADMLNAPGCTGDHIKNSQRVENSFRTEEAEDVRYSIRVVVGSTKNTSDVYACGNGELIYEGVSAGFDCARGRFCFLLGAGNQDLEYSSSIHTSSYLFGCVGLRSKKYCILNKQYSKDEYEKLVPKLRKHMKEIPYTDARGLVYRYGEFFPSELSPFAYNETIAQEYFPLTKSEAKSKGFRWREAEEKHPEITIRPEDIPDNIQEIQDDALQAVIGCAHEGKCSEQCTIALKLIPDELQFYRNLNLPIPRLCPNCRHFERLKQMNPYKLWHRQCMCLSSEALAKEDAYQNTSEHFHGSDPCPNEFQTSYSPERKEIVYCESCYNSEVV